MQPALDIVASLAFTLGERERERERERLCELYRFLTDDWLEPRDDLAK